MSQYIEIARLDLDIDAITKKAVETKKSIVEISQEIAHLKSRQEEAQRNISDYTTYLEKMTKAGRENSEEAQALQRAIERNKEVFDSTTRSLVEQEAQIKKHQQEYRVYNSVLTSKAESSLKNIDIMKAEGGSINELSAALSHNKAVYKQLSEEERNKNEKAKELLETIKAQDAQYKELSKSIGNTQVEVGNYREEVKKALDEHFNFDNALNKASSNFGAFGSVVVASGKALKQFVVGQKSAETSTKATSVALKVFRGALVATGIGAIVVLLGSLVSYFTSTQEGINKVNSVLIPLKTTFATLKGVLQNIGKAFVDTFQNSVSGIVDVGKSIGKFIILPFTQAIATAKAFGKVLSGNFKDAWAEFKAPMSEIIDDGKSGFNKLGNSFKEVKNAVGDLGDTFDEAWKRGKRIAEINEELSKGEADFIEQTAKLKEEFREQNLIAEDTTKSLKKREEASKKSIEIQRQINALARERNLLEVERLELQLQSNDTSDAERTELARKKAELSEANAEMLRSETMQQKKLNNIRKEANNQYKQQLKANLEEEKKMIDDYLSSGSSVAQSLQERLALEEKAKNERLAILEKEKKSGLITKNDYERQKQQIELEYLGTRAELSTANAGKELELYIAQNQSKIDNEKRLTQELIQEEQARQEAIYNKKVEALENEKALKQEAGQWSYEQEQEFELQRLELNQDFKDQQKALDKTWQSQQHQEKKELQEVEFAERLLRMEEENASQWEIQQEQLNQKYEKELALLDESFAKGQISTELYLAKKTNLEKDQAKASKRIVQAKAEAELSTMSSMFSQLQGLAGEHTALGKASAIAEATINTYLGATKALSSFGYPMGGIMAALTIASGLQNVAKIVSIPTPEAKKYALGGFVAKGKSHEQGGIPFSVAGEGGYEMEGGEFISSKKATALFLPQLEYFNKVANGQASTTNYRHFANGGLVQRSIVNNLSQDVTIDMEAIKEAVREGASAGASQGTYAGALQGTQLGTFEGIREQNMNAFFEKQSNI